MPPPKEWRVPPRQMTRYDRSALISGLLGLLPCLVLGNGLFETAVSLDDLDLEASQSFFDGKPEPTSTETLSALVTVAAGEANWSAGTPPGNNPKPISAQYRIAFTRPLPIGTMVATLDLRERGGESFRYLKPDAPYPGDPDTEEHWESIPVRDNCGHFEFTFPPGFTTRAVLCSHQRHRWPSVLHKWHLLKPRLHNVTPYAVAQGERAPYGSDPANITTGRPWQNAGMDREQRVHRAPVSSVNPSWFILTWDKPRKPMAIRLHSNVDEAKLYAFTGPERENPALAGPESWERLKSSVVYKGEQAREGSARILSLQPVETRAIKLLLLETYPKESQIAHISDLTMWSNLGTAPVPAPPQQDRPPPFQIPYELHTDAEVALVLDDVQGKRVRNLIAQVERKAGKNAEPWDLKDEDGLPIPVGKYRWKAIYAPPLELHYQMTPYPNTFLHSPESRPWNGRPQDGWLSNHGNQCAVCAVGDRVYIAAGGTEGGHAFIETTLEGVKRWGTHWGANHLFTDGRTLFIHTGGLITSFEPDTRSRKDLIRYDGDPQRKGRLVGMAAKAGKVYLAFHSPIPYLDNATHGGIVDIDHCLPKYPPKVERTANYGIPASPQRDFISLFRLGGYLAGDPHFGGLIYLESTSGPARKQHILLALRKPTPLGSLVFPRPEDPKLELGLSVLRPGAPWPPRVRAEPDWVALDTGKLDYWNCVAAPEGTVTRALRITFTQPGEDFADELEDEGEDPDKPRLDLSLEEDKGNDELSTEKKRKAWKARLEGIRLLRRRFGSLLATAKVRMSSGIFDAEKGEWDAQRTEVISEEDPGVFVLEWEQPQKVRGLAIKEIDGERTEIDVYEGPPGRKIDIKGAEHWRHVATHRQARRNFYQPDASNNAEARYLDGCVDFGAEYETRAVRLRIVRQWVEQGGYPRGVRRDRGGTDIDPKRCRVYGVAPLQYLGGETPTDSLIAQRLSIHDAETGKLVQERPSSIRGAISFSPSGDLHGIEGAKIVRIDEEAGARTELVTDVREPRLLTFDHQGRLYVYDNHPDERNVRVYDPGGEYLHSIGRRGPKKAGSWDPTSLAEVCAMSVDRAGGIWLVYPHENPRRVIQFKTDGTFVKEYLGNTHYGGGGVLDPYDKSRLFYKDVVFGLDWENGTSAVKSLLSLNYWEASPWSGNAFRSDMEPIKVGGRLYLVTAPLVVHHQQSVGVVYLVDEATLTMRMVAAAGSAAAFPFVKTPEFSKHLGGRPMGDFSFSWADRNGDGQVQLREVEFSPTGREGLGRFERDLSVAAGAIRYEVKEFLPDGTPLYQREKMPFSALFRLDNGNHFRFSERGTGQDNGVNEVVSPTGERIWTYWAWGGVSGLWIPDWRPGYVTNQLGISGRAVADEGDLGEFFVIHANTGQMNLWTADGLLAGHLTLHLRDPRARGWPAEHHRGARLDGLTLGQEHFHHHFCKTEQDGKYYIVAGGNHISVVEVKGLEKFRRLSGEFEVTPEILHQTQEWESRRVRKQVFARAPLIECPRFESPPKLDGNPEPKEWGGEGSGAEMPNFATFRMGYDEAFLYLCWETRNAGPLRNIGDDFRRYFKTGGAVDLKLGTDPDADPRRKRPAEGDLRLLITVVKDEPVAVLYRPIAPDAPKTQDWKTSTPAGGTVAFEQVIRLAGARIAPGNRENGYAVEAAIPLSALGLKIRRGMLVKMDWGVLSTERGNLTTARDYWANKMAVGTTDEPTEAKLAPCLWGNVRFVESRKAEPGTLKPGEVPGEATEGEVEDLLDQPLEIEE